MFTCMTAAMTLRPPAICRHHTKHLFTVALVDLASARCNLIVQV
jgi:hypothetical protein